MRHPYRLAAALALAALCGPALAAVTTNIESGFSVQGDRVRYSKYTLSTAETSAWFRVNAGDTVAVLTAGSTCKAQLAIGLPSEADGGTAVAVDWAPGAVATPTSRVVEGPMYAVRFVSSAGSCIGMIVQKVVSR